MTSYSVVFIVPLFIELATTDRCGYILHEVIVCVCINTTPPCYDRYKYHNTTPSYRALFKLINSALSTNGKRNHHATVQWWVILCVVRQGPFTLLSLYIIVVGQPCMN